MFDHNTHHGIGNSISLRASLASELAEKLADQDRRDAKLREHLLKKAPKELHEWLENDLVFTLLFKYGRTDTKIDFGDYGFKDFADVSAKLKILGRVWRDVVLIRLGEPEPHRVQVWITALM